MKRLALHANSVRKFRDEYLSAVPSIIAQASPVPPARRWDALFQCSIQPKSELVDPEVQTSLMALYRASSIEELIPSYFGDTDRWGAIVSPRVATATGNPLAFIEHWFVTHPGDIDCMTLVVKNQWPHPFEAIVLPIFPHHRCRAFLADGSRARLRECAYVAEWRRSQPAMPSAWQSGRYSCFMNHDVDSWWPGFARLLEREEAMSDREINVLRAGMAHCLRTGGIILLYDEQGLAAHVSWARGSEAELLLPQCQSIHYVWVRPDSRGQGMSRYLYAVVAEQLDAGERSLVCARMRAGNLSSIKNFEGVGGVCVREYYEMS